MLIRLYKGNQPIVIILIIITAVLLWLKTFIDLPYTEFRFDEHVMPLYELITRFFSPDLAISYYFTLVLIVLSAFLLVQINTRFLLINERTYLPAILFILLASAYVPLQRLQPLYICQILMIFIMGRIFDSYRQQQLSFRFFDASLLVSIGSFIYFNFAFYMVIVWAGLIIFRQFRWREWAFSFIGFALPYVFVFSYHYLVNDTIEPLLKLIQYQIVTYHPMPKMEDIFLIFYGFLGLFLIITSFSMMREITKKKIQARKYFLFLLWLFLITWGLFFASPNASVELLVINTIPLSFLFSHYFIIAKKEYLGDLFLAVCMAFIVYIQFTS